MGAVKLLMGVAFAAVGLMFVGRRRRVRLVAGRRYRATSNVEHLNAQQKALVLGGLAEFGAVLVPSLDDKVFVYDVTARSDRDFTPGVSSFTFGNPFNQAESVELVVQSIVEVP